MKEVKPENKGKNPFFVFRFLPVAIYRGSLLTFFFFFLFFFLTRQNDSRTFDQLLIRSWEVIRSWPCHCWCWNRILCSKSTFIAPKLILLSLNIYIYIIFLPNISDSRTSSKTLFYQSGLHPYELGDIGRYDTKEKRKYELFGQYFTEQDTNADTRWTSGLKSFGLLFYEGGVYSIQPFLCINDYGIGTNGVFSIYNSFMIPHFASLRECCCSSLCWKRKRWASKIIMVNSTDRVI